MICGLFVIGLAAQDAPRAKDEREYALVQQALAERDAAKRLETLRDWSKEYEDSALVKLRAQLYLQAYREAGRTSDAVGAAEILIEMAPEDFAARYTLASLAPALGEISEPALGRAERAARALIGGGIERQFEQGKRPDGVSAEAWEKARRETQATSLRTLAWIAMQRKQHAEAEARLLESLEIDPASAQASYWLAQSALAQRDPAKNELAFFSLARAAARTGPGALPADSREKIDAYLEKIYLAFAGTLEGLEELTLLAAETALPPEGMPRILSGAERKAIEEEQLCKAKPLECAYRKLRFALEGEGGEAVWSDLRGKVTPQMRLFVVANEPADRPLELRLSATKGGETEVVLRLENRRREAVPIGRAVTVEGVATGLERSPFRLTLEQGRVVE
jgi:tetratricopeptide (TPR) repeat protein